MKSSRISIARHIENRTDLFGEIKIQSVDNDGVGPIMSAINQIKSNILNPVLYLMGLVYKLNHYKTCLKEDNVDCVST